MASTTGLITVAEFEKIPDPPGGKYELVNGELVFVARPPIIHQEIQMAIAFALHPQIARFGHLGVELGFRPTLEHNEWSADVGFVVRQRWEAVPKSQCFAGAPDLVVEVLSPSNSAFDMNEREAVCLANGSRQFWIADSNLRILKVTTPDRKTIAYRIGHEIDLAEFGGGTLSVAEIFAE